MSSPRPPIIERCAAFCLLSILSFSTSGCASLLTEGSAAGAGVAGAGIAGSVTKNASATAAIGLGVNAAALAGVKSLEKKVHGDEQTAIAAAAGPLDLGAVGRWSAVHRIPIEKSEHGDLTVSRVIKLGDLDCKEIVFSVVGSGRVARRDFYVTTVCRDGATWRWAAAEPATRRWGALQ